MRKRLFMQPFITEFLLVGFLLLFLGCSSSERMTRISGNVLSSYTPPAEERISSARFKAKSNSFFSADKERQEAIRAMDERLVNIWPFYFRNYHYLSILWPLIDVDDYGFAVRPFFNQEGDEYSVLFPLAAWNPRNKDGWVGNVFWDPESFMILPFFVTTDDAESKFIYATPFFLYDKDHKPIGYDADSNTLTTRSSHFLEAMLFSRKKTDCLDVGDHSTLFADHKSNSATLNEYLVRRNLPMNPTPEELKRLRQETAATLPRYQQNLYGFFPLFSYESSTNGKEFSFMAPGGLWIWEKGSDSNLHVFLLGLGASYRSYISSDGLPTREFFSLPLLTGFSVTSHYRETEEYKKFSNLQNWLMEAKMSQFRNDNSFSVKRPEIEQALQDLTPALSLPERVKDWASCEAYLEAFLKEYKTESNFPIEEKSRTFSTFPLVHYEQNAADTNLFSIALLTGFYSNGKRSRLISAPLLTYREADEETGEKNLFAGPLCYVSTTSEREALGSIPIYSANTRTVENSADCLQSDFSIAGFGAYYSIGKTFLTAKDGVDHQAAETLRSNLDIIDFNKQEMEYLQQQLNEKTAELERLQSTLPKRPAETLTLAEQEQLLAFRQKELDVQVQQHAVKKLESQQQSLLETCKTLAERVNFELDLSPEALKGWNGSHGDKLQEQLCRQLSTQRKTSIQGCWLFYWQETFWNGDCSWWAMCGLAGGEKIGNQENSHVLYYLYRHRRDGDQSETLVFPFISIQEDGANRRVSFMGKLYERKVIDGKTSGSFFFIPWGE